MFRKIFNFVKEHKKEIAVIGGLTIAGGVSTYVGYKIGSKNGYDEGYKYGCGNTLVNVALGREAGCTFLDKTYEFFSKETTQEEMTKDPTILFNANEYMSNCTDI